MYMNTYILIICINLMFIYLDEFHLLYAYLSVIIYIHTYACLCLYICSRLITYCGNKPFPRII